MAELLPSPSDLIFYRTKDSQTRIEVPLAGEQHEVPNQQHLKQETEEATLTDDAELKKYLGGEK